MARLTTMDVRKIGDLERSIRTIPCGTPIAHSAILDEGRTLFDADRAAAYALRREGDSFRIEFAQGSGLLLPDDVLPSRFDADLAASRVTFLYDPRRPQRRQRNRAMTTEQLTASRTPAPSLARGVFGLAGLDGRDQLRVLVCDGAALLGFIGFYRCEPFSRRDVRVFQRLVPALRERLLTERLLNGARLSEAAMDAALGAIPRAAWLVDERGQVRCANQLGKEGWRKHRPTIERSLRSRTLGVPEYGFVRVESGGIGLHYLVLAAETNRLGACVSDAAVRWGLTKRQCDVLALLARGAPNKTIAVSLGLAESTVELHVSAILTRAEAECRAELVAKVWGGDSIV